MRSGRRGASRSWIGRNRRFATPWFAFMNRGTRIEGSNQGGGKDGSGQNTGLGETFPGFAEIPGTLARLIEQTAYVEQISTYVEQI